MNDDKHVGSRKRAECAVEVALNATSREAHGHHHHRVVQWCPVGALGPASQYSLAASVPRLSHDPGTPWAGPAEDSARAQ